ncbi:MAG: histidine phosphatase family protein [Bacillota bacterium]
MTYVHLIRHGTTDSNIYGRFQGSQDISLNERGLRQAYYLGIRFKNIRLDTVFVSPLLRARQTAACLCRYQTCRAIICNDLREIDGGDLEGRTHAENEQKYPDEMYRMRVCPAYFQAPNGETARQVYDRMRNAVTEIVKNYPNQMIAIVSHGFAIQTYLNFAKGLPFNKMERRIVGNTAVSKLVFDKNLRPAIEYWGDDSHLPQELKFYLATNLSNNSQGA